MSERRSLETSSFFIIIPPMRKFIGTFFLVVTFLMIGGCFLAVTNLVDGFPQHEKKVKEKSILHMKLEGVILDPTKFLEDLKKYSKDDDIKGVILQVNSPGGIVGPSQEIYHELKRVRTELKKPIVVSTTGMAASGAYYAAVAANEIYTNEGSLLGSIGVIMEFANLEKLYDWMKIQRHVIKTGKYKDSGAEYRPMREDEKQLFRSMAFEILNQFKAAIVEGRKLPPELVSQYSDGRVFTGETAVKLGFADKIGTFEDARRAIGQLTGLGADPDLFEPPKKRPSFTEILSEMNTPLKIEMPTEKLLKSQLWGQPLYLLPSALPQVTE